MCTQTSKADHAGFAEQVLVFESFSTARLAWCLAGSHVIALITVEVCWCRRVGIGFLCAASFGQSLMPKNCACRNVCFKTLLLL